MEKGEVGILAGQFAALVLAILVLSNFASGSSNVLSTPTIGTVYWGSPSNNLQLSKGVTNTETANASNMTVHYTLAFSTVPASITATRLCIAPNDTGEQLVYTLIPINQGKDYFSFGSTEQIPGESCTYTVSLTDSLQQVVTWVAIVTVKT